MSSWTEPPESDGRGSPCDECHSAGTPCRTSSTPMRNWTSKMNCNLWVRLLTDHAVCRTIYSDNTNYATWILQPLTLAIGMFYLFLHISVTQHLTYQKFLSVYAWWSCVGKNKELVGFKPWTSGFENKTNNHKMRKSMFPAR